MLLHVGLTRVTRETIAFAVNETSFDTLREKEINGAFGNRLSVGDINDVRTFKTRAGKVGGFRGDKINLFFSAFDAHGVV